MLKVTVDVISIQVRESQEETDKQDTSAQSEEVHQLLKLNKLQMLGRMAIASLLITEM
jgi:hypothetical protein